MTRILDGKILGGLGGLYRVLAEDGQVYRTRAKGALRRDENRALVGDAVSLAVGDLPDDVVIRELKPRKNMLIRPPVSNLDTLFVVAAVTHPAPILSTLDKMTAILTHAGISPVMVFTKSELSDRETARLSSIYNKVGIPTFTVSAMQGDGLRPLSAYVENVLAGGRSAAFAGASGVGKSTLLNALFPSLALETGDISARIERGRHTTRAVELFPLFGGYLADTPGFSLLDFTRFDFFSLADLPHTFPEFSTYLGRCRYADCTHTKEEECAVRRAVAAGDIPESRFLSYRAIYDALKEKRPYDK